MTVNKNNNEEGNKQHGRGLERWSGGWQVDWIKIRPRQWTWRTTTTMRAINNNNNDDQNNEVVNCELNKLISKLAQLQAFKEYIWWMDRRHLYATTPFHPSGRRKPLQCTLMGWWSDCPTMMECVLIQPSLHFPDKKSMMTAWIFPSMERTRTLLCLSPSQGRWKLHWSIPSRMMPSMLVVFSPSTITILSTSSCVFPITARQVFMDTLVVFSPSLLTIFSKSTLSFPIPNCDKGLALYL